MSDDHFGNLAVPGQTYVGNVEDPEILFSTATGSYLEKGVTIAAGQGVLPAGQCIAQNTTDKKYYIYAEAGVDGVGVCLGILHREVGSDDVDVQANILFRGSVKGEMLVGLTAAAIVDLNGRTLVRADQDVFIF
jgi:hypothetical protein